MENFVEARYGRDKWKLHARESDFERGIINEKLLSDPVGSMIGHMVHANTLNLRRQWLTRAANRSRITRLFAGLGEKHVTRLDHR
ncbi:MAG: hypothetical protein HQL91_01350 [Magnetococcales bacterium]|nr:hypothetical protein [Magnetococcales bacterium]